MLAGTRIPHHPHVRAHHAAIPPHSQLHGDFTSERVGSTTRRLHQRVRLAILYRIDTWYVLLNRSWRGATAILHLCLMTSNSV